MKLSILIGLAALTSACAHETTTMDREMALILAKRGDMHVVQATPPVINIYNGGLNAAGTAAPEPSAAVKETACVDSPVYSYEGKLLRYKQNCFGAQ